MTFLFQSNFKFFLVSFRPLALNRLNIFPEILKSVKISQICLLHISKNLVNSIYFYSKNISIFIHLGQTLKIVLW